MPRFNREEILENVKSVLPNLSLETLAFLHGRLMDSVECQYEAMRITAIWDSYLRKRELEDNVATTKEVAKLILNFLREKDENEEK